MRGPLVFLALVFSCLGQPLPTVQERAHASQVLGGQRTYRVLLPPSYATSQKRYPVLYWLYGYTNSSPDGKGPMGAYAATHDIIVVSAGPVETVGTYPLYFPELVDNVDRNFRTIADRGHRGISGFGMGGFLALWTAGKFPDLLASASTLRGFATAPLGPEGIELRYRNDEVPGNYEGVRTLPTTESLESLMEFHGKAFADPPARPAAFDHADVYPNFTVWGWEVVSDRRQPGYTVLENVSAKGFRSAVQEWVPGGATLPAVKISVASAPRLYVPGSAHTVTYIHLRDGKVRRTSQKADPQGRLSFDLDGDAWEVGVSAEPLLAVAGYELADAGWATEGKPVTLRVKFWNKGGARSATVPLKWESETAGVQFNPPTARVFGLAPGESGTVPVTLTAPAGKIRIVAVDGSNRMPMELTVFPPAEAAKLFQIADGVTVQAIQHGTQHAELTFGEGNRDNHASPGESFAILFPDGEYLRPAELFTGDSCVDNTVRGTDSWGEYDSVTYSLPSIRQDCEPGHPIHMLAKVVLPGGETRYWAIEFPVWYRN